MILSLHIAENIFLKLHYSLSNKYSIINDNEKEFILKMILFSSAVSDIEPVFMCSIRRLSGWASSCWKFWWPSSRYAQGKSKQLPLLLFHYALPIISWCCLQQLGSVLTWLGLSKSEADLHLKWAATNTAFIMSQHCETRSRLAEAMALGKPIGLCIDAIENCLQGIEIWKSIFVIFE